MSVIAGHRVLVSEHLLLRVKNHAALIRVKKDASPGSRAGDALGRASELLA
jgi:hypothetical protein